MCAPTTSRQMTPRSIYAGLAILEESVTTDGLVTLNLRVGAMRDNWSVHFFVENLTEEENVLGRPIGALASYLVQQPRTFGITVRGGF